MNGMRRLGLIIGLCSITFAYAVAQDLAPAPSGVTVPAATATDPGPWPRTVEAAGQKVVLHQPQLDSWQGNRLKGRIAVSIDQGTKSAPDGKQHDVLVYGVLWFNARTDVDKVARKVALSDIAIDKVSFPTDSKDEPHYLAMLKSIAAEGGQTVSLDTLEAELAINQQVTASNTSGVKNTPPDIVFAFHPALLVLIDGTPRYVATGFAGVRRVINTRSLILEHDGHHYLEFAKRWATATSLSGPWTETAHVPAEIEQAGSKAVAAHLVDVLEQPDAALKKILDSGTFPEIHVSSHPTELITIDGAPEFTAIPGTQLAYVANTPSDVFIDNAHAQAWYVLLSGRWFTAESTKGPWRYVEGSALPADFARIPPDSLKSAVLASIPGTPEARESLIANSIPQTATVNRKQARLDVHYDGQPQFRAIEGTQLAYAWNTAVPVIRVSTSGYYAVQNGVWFTATQAAGPWSVALDVPSAIYAIPASSPVHYVTYVHVYGHTDDYVYVGYTPGYYGTVVSDNVVVYGTGYACDAWVGNVWYGCPTTYGFGVAFGYDPWVGWSFGFAWGWAWAAAWYGPWWGPWSYWGGYYPGYWGGGIATANIYGRWGNSVVAGVGAAWADPWTGNYGQAARGRYYNQVTGGRGVGYAGRNTNVYTGTTTTQAGGIRYNPQTGRVVAGQGGAAYNHYTGDAAAAGQHTAVNTNTGRVTHESGAAGRDSSGAGASGTFNSKGAGGDASGAGYVHYDRATGDVTHGGVVNVNDHVYAGKDGNVYQYTKGQGWQPVDKPGNGSNASRPGADGAGVERDRAARERGADRNFSRNPSQQTERPQFDRSNYNGNFHGNMGGFRPAAGGGHFGGRRR